jgi:hypothetical protein
MATNGSNLRRGAPRGKRKLPRGVVCVRRCITLHPRHDEILERIGRSIPGGRPAIARRCGSERGPSKLACQHRCQLIIVNSPGRDGVHEDERN